MPDQLSARNLSRHGHCLNVHEGPQSIRMEENPVILEPGMVMSDEPAMYRPGEYGIRTENMILIREDSETNSESSSVSKL